MKKLIQLAVTAALSLPAFAQTPVAEMSNAVLVGPEGITITAISSPTAVLQFGIGTTWCSAITAPKLPLSVDYSSPNLALCPFDPLQGVVKSIVAKQQATAYTVTYTLNGATTTKTIPALAPTSTTYAITCTATVTLTAGAPLPATLPITASSCTAVKK